MEAFSEDFKPLKIYSSIKRAVSYRIFSASHISLHVLPPEALFLPSSSPSATPVPGTLSISHSALQSQHIQERICYYLCLHIFQWGMNSLPLISYQKTEKLNSCPLLEEFSREQEKHLGGKDFPFSPLSSPSFIEI